ncbi:peptidylprolyl isomerase [Pedobacter insulae]|uniref:Peptidyl-prolyl cis-trans isomerase n=1 Tax=Pedobacter insulae TaxID=414048 RepID=A0A1I2XCN1_9SPHI|nr:peptidylprolyl isomerase [Pedobacter insulae]SFH11258.1 peptidyl-prolyl cis-trans isomerase B (cyclophilin B) [Pedobacter insulae]
MKKLLTLLLCLCLLNAYAAKPKNQYVRIATDRGTVIIKLYNETPLHRDNFIKLAKEGQLDGTLFHRVIKDFMIQGGDTKSKNAHPDSTLGNGGLPYTVKAEFVDSLFHKKGALGAAREGDRSNPTKASSSTQFYIVQGKIWTDSTLNATEETRLKFKIPEWQRQIYKTIGGTPHLDRNYTVYGEVVKGLEMVDAIANEPTGKADRPTRDVSMTVTVLKRREVRKLERELKKNKV